MDLMGICFTKQRWLSQLNCPCGSRCNIQLWLRKDSEIESRNNILEERKNKNISPNCSDDNSVQFQMHFKRIH